MVFYFCSLFSMSRTKSFLCVISIYCYLCDLRVFSFCRPCPASNSCRNCALMGERDLSVMVTQHRFKKERSRGHEVCRTLAHLRMWKRTGRFAMMANLFDNPSRFAFFEFEALVLLTSLGYGSRVCFQAFLLGRFSHFRFFY